MIVDAATPAGDWVLSYDGFEPEQEGLREVLCALGNGTIVSRAAAPNALADDVHYPGSYLAGGYDRLATTIAGETIENEDLVNLPNWLPLVFRIADGPWLRPGDVEQIGYRQALDLHAGVLRRVVRMRDGDGRVVRWDEERIVSMHAPHLAALRVALTPENFSDPMTIRAGLDGSVINWGVKRYRELNGRHLETLDTGAVEGDVLTLRSRFVQARREVALAARTRVTAAGGPVVPARIETLANQASHEFDVAAREGQAMVVEKIAAYASSQDKASSEPLLEAVKHVRRAGPFSELRAAHVKAWAHLWQQADIRVESEADQEAQLKLRLHIFHLLQTASGHSVDRDVGVPPRGWHGEAYRGHIMWDELFIFPYLNLRLPVLTRALLRYRYRRLDEARRLAAEAGLRGAMFPWQSGSDGREESQRIHLNPVSGNWIPDNSWRQRHIGAAVAYNVWQYVEATDDRGFLRDYGAELFLEIARFFASLAERRPDGRWGICGVMGPDEFHTAYPGADPRTEGGLDNNAYTNVMASWLLTRVVDVLDLLAPDDRARLIDRLEITDAELALWTEISRGLFIPFHDDGIISQFEGWEQLKEFDWDGYREKYGNIQRLDRLLEAEGDHPNHYKVSKQADVLMIFYLFSREEIDEIFHRLGYAFSPEQIFRNIQYYGRRTSHGSTLSFVTHAWVLARSDRQRSWALALQALDADIADVQGGTTQEGIHLGAMAGTVDLMQRCYTGIEVATGALLFNPRLPEEMRCLRTTVRYRRQVLDIEVDQERLTVSSRVMTASPVVIAYRGHARAISPGQSFAFELVREVKPDRPARESEQKRARAEHAEEQARDEQAGPESPSE
ncbi:glycosyl hydrolase family 65 protein [Salinarimonas sp.]|uniref:glycoside hydrolase family 65 protein n=1 Tax=Salinarimonas sp. TaxID=2766526 RepID=UPI0032D90BA7